MTVRPPSLNPNLLARSTLRQHPQHNRHIASGGCLYRSSFFEYLLCGWGSFLCVSVLLCACYSGLINAHRLLYPMGYHVLMALPTLAHSPQPNSEQPVHSPSSSTPPPNTMPHDFSLEEIRRWLSHSFGACGCLWVSASLLMLYCGIFALLSARSWYDQSLSLTPLLSQH